MLDKHDNYLASNQFDLDQFSLSERHALFDLRHFVAVYHTDAEELAAMAATGVLIAEKVLGAEIFTHLVASRAERTLHIRLPACVGTLAADAFHAALSRIPWEIARPSAAKAPLSEMALRVLINHHMAQPASSALPLPSSKPRCPNCKSAWMHGWRRWNRKHWPTENQPNSGWCKRLQRLHRHSRMHLAGIQCCANC